MWLRYFLAVVISTASSAWMLMFTFALFGHPQFGFLNLWLASDTVSSVIGTGVLGGLYTFKRLLGN